MPRFQPAVRFTSICSAAALIAAGAGWQARQHERLRELPFTDVTLGPVQFPTPTIHTYRSPAPLRRYVLAAEPGRTVRQLDFGGGRYELILVALGPRSSTGYSVDVLSVEEQRSRLVVRARQRAPQLGARVRPVVTFPYRLLRVPARHKAATIVWETAKGAA
jgi:protease stability complex PrcB-like protein